MGEPAMPDLLTLGGVSTSAPAGAWAADADGDIDQHAGRLVRLIGWGFLALNSPNTDGKLKCARLEVYRQG